MKTNLNPDREELLVRRKFIEETIRKLIKEKEEIDNLLNGGQLSISELGLPQQAHNAFRRVGIKNLDDLIEYYYANRKTFIAIRNVGIKINEIVITQLKEEGYL